jgi:hypothetical protein
MGAVTFYNKVTTKGTAKEAFKEVMENALYMHGHGGYSGTIAEKSDYSLSRKPEDFDPNEWIELVEDFDPEDRTQEHYHDLKRDFKIYDDKWGPALCVPTEDGFIFCGWASS